MSKPFFSVVVAIYNAEKYLDELILSVLNQICGDFELLLVDDGSTDKSGEICDRYISDIRVKVFHTKNQGGLEARYYGVKRTNGIYVLVIDADDRLPPDCLQNAKRVLENVECDMLIGGMQSFGDRCTVSLCSLEAGKMYSGEEVACMCVADTNHSLCTKIIARDIVIGSCSCPLGYLTMNTDYAMLIPILCKIRNAYVTDMILYEYRIYNSSVSHYGTAQKIIDTGKVTEYAETEFRSNGMLDARLEDAVYSSYLRMISGRLWNLLLCKSITKEDCGIIHRQASYRKSERFEGKDLLGRKLYFVMRFFRKGYYWVFDIFSFAKKIKNILNNGG